jgi:CelD/BcsL family acetyltransferase involved in cellulose biosynthesis
LRHPKSDREEAALVGGLFRRTDIDTRAQSSSAARLSFRLLADVITITPHAIFKRVQAAWAVLDDARLGEVVDDLWRHSEPSG